MSNMFSKLSLYDQVGYLLVGSIALLVAYADTVILSMPFPSFTAANLVIWFSCRVFLRPCHPGDREPSCKREERRVL